MALTTIATIAGLAASAASLAYTGYSLANMPGSPSFPDGASASREISDAQAKFLPIQKALQAAEQQGGKVTIPNYPSHNEKVQYILIPAGWEHKDDINSIGAWAAGPSAGLLDQMFGNEEQQWKAVPYKPEEWEGKTLPSDPYWTQITVPEGPKTFDFTGSGTADIQSALAKAYTDIQLDLGRKYGTQFAEEAGKEVRLADPLGAQARDKELELIKKQQQLPTSPLHGQLEKGISGQLKAGSGLDPESRALLDKSVAEANLARSGGLLSGDVAQSMSTGMEGQMRRDMALNKSLGFLTSGQTPEDVEYKRKQQEVANLASFVGGRTPQSQFGALRQANQGAAPLTEAQQGATMPNNANSLGNAYSMAKYSADTQGLMSQTSPWMAGLSSLLGLTNTVAKAAG